MNQIRALSPVPCQGIICFEGENLEPHSQTKQPEESLLLQETGQFPRGS
jgi:hypothetical protein